VTALAEVVGANLAVAFFLLLLVVIGWQGEKRAEPPAELVAAVSSWPPPSRGTLEHSPYWHPRWDLEVVRDLPPPPPWTRVGA
jgi:hypothetical protein